MSVLNGYRQISYQLHWIVACCIISFLNRVLSKGLYYRPFSHLDIVGYSDADWAGDPIDRHFTTVYCIFIGSNLVTWQCKI